MHPAWSCEPFIFYMNIYTQFAHMPGTQFVISKVLHI